MALVELVMPKLGESIMEATILKWLKQPGDRIALDEPVLEIATDKVDSEVPSSSEGILESILYQVNDVVPIGTVIATIKTTGESENLSTPVIPTSFDVEPKNLKEEHASQIALQKTPLPEPINTSRFYSPLVLTIASSEGISMAELEKLPGTGQDGRVTKKDILEYVHGRTGNLPKARIQHNPPPPAQAPDLKQKQETVEPPLVTPSQFHVTPDASVEIIEMDRMRKMISQHMVHSKHTSPHVTSFSEADVTNLVIWREKVKGSYEKSHGEKITLTPLFIEAIVKCIQKFPLINSSVDGDRIIIKKNINIGMATALPNGNLIVPVIKHSEELNIIGLTKQVNFLANAARNNKLRPDDTSGGTFTFTNVGVFGSLMGTPIISQPQVAIIAVGAIKKRPVVIESEFGDTIAIRHMMYLSMSYDHRIIDGALGASFLTAVARELESFDPNRTV